MKRIKQLFALIIVVMVFMAAKRSTIANVKPVVIGYVTGYSGLINPDQINAQAWTPQNSVNPSFPRLSLAGSNLNDPAAHPSNYWFRSSDYLRIKTAEFSYSLPKNFVNKIGLQVARIYVNGYNLVTWGLKEKNIYNTDPENTSGNDGAGFYPQTKVYNLGLQISF